MSMFTRIILALGCIVLGASPAFAELSWTAFLTAAGAASNVRFLDTGVEPQYLGTIGKQINLEHDSLVGLHVDKILDESFTATARIVAKGQQDWQVKATRAFIQYSPTKNWFWRLGRQPVLHLVHSEDINHSFKYPWLVLPESLYAMIPYHYLDAASLGVRFALWNRDLRFQGTYGSLSQDITNPISDVSLKYKARQFAHLTSSFGNELIRLQASYSVGRITWGPNPAHESINTFINGVILSGLLGQDFHNYLTIDNERIQYQSIGYTFDWKRLFSNAEYLRRKSSATLIPNLIAWYVMLGAKFYDETFHPYVAFSRQRITDNQTRRFMYPVNNAALMAPPNGLGQMLDSTVQNYAEGLDGPVAGDQTSYSVGLRWFVIKLVSVKAVYEHIHPDRRGSGLFHVHPHKSVNIYRFGVDTSFDSLAS